MPPTPCLGLHVGQLDRGAGAPQVPAVQGAPRLPVLLRGGREGPGNSSEEKAAPEWALDFVGIRADVSERCR